MKLSERIAELELEIDLLIALVEESKEDFIPIPPDVMRRIKDLKRVLRSVISAGGVRRDR